MFSPLESCISFCPSSDFNILQFTSLDLMIEMDRSEFCDLVALLRYSFLKGKSIHGKILLTRRPDPTPEPISPTYHRSLSENYAVRNERAFGQSRRGITSW
ncbi:unnamed protein product [Eruca vesicaria subsp. sativa]|uniref:Uncharacterized protein n=1 Tax=Eruca vesicaria subsp. sativa TaxID=29727 RepID=A0ABC8JP86_ERUVS|nr:unnamed protein product [Eruca vesicaria subsp. sativa]